MSNGQSCKSSSKRIIVCRRGNSFVLKLRKSVLWLFYQNFPEAPKTTPIFHHHFKYHWILLDYKVLLQSFFFSSLLFLINKNSSLMGCFQKPETQCVLCLIFTGRVCKVQQFVFTVEEILWCFLDQWTSRNFTKMVSFLGVYIPPSDSHVSY